MKTKTQPSKPVESNQIIAKSSEFIQTGVKIWLSTALEYYLIERYY